MWTRLLAVFSKKSDAVIKAQKSISVGLNDAVWGEYNHSILEFANKGLWGEYRNARLDIADLLAKEKNFKEALKTYLEVCYLDLNSPNNCPGYEGIDEKIVADLLKDFIPFGPEKGDLAPVVVDCINQLRERLKLSDDELRKIFLECNSKIYRSLRLPLAPEKCWVCLKQVTL